MTKPRVILRSVADHYAAPGERIVEFSFADGTGGLISFRQPADGRLGRIDVYRTDGRVSVSVPQPQDRR